MDKKVSVIVRITLVLLALLTFAGPADAVTRKLTTKDGLVIEYVEAFFEGEYVSIKMPNGQMKLPIHAISEKSLEEMMMAPEGPKTPPAAETKVPAPAGTVPAAAGPAVPSPVPGAVTVPAPTVSKPLTVANPGPGAPIMPAITGYSFPILCQLDLKPDYPEIDPKVEIKKVQLEIDSNTYDKKKVKVEVRIPFLNGQPGPNAHHLVFHAPYPTESVNLDQNHHRFYSEVFGFTVFSFSMKASGEDLADPKKCYWYAESGWHDVVFAAQKLIVENYKLKPEKLLISTESAGSNMTQRMALANPDKIRAVALYGGADYMEVKTPTPVAWLVMHGRGDSTLDASVKLTEQLKAVGSDVIYTPTAPDYLNRGQALYYHVPSIQSRSLQAAYLWAIANKPEMDLPEKRRQLWPYVSSAKEHGLVFDNSEAGRSRLDPLDLNYLPGPAFAALWIKTPGLLQSSLLQGSKTAAKTMLITPPSGTLSKGLVVYGDTYRFTNYPRTVEDMHCLANAGYVVIASKSAKSGPEDIDSFLDAVRLWQSREKRVAGLPVFFIGYGQTGVDFYKKTREQLSGSLQALGLSEIPDDKERTEALANLKEFGQNGSILLAGVDDPENKNGLKELQRLEKKSTKLPLVRVLPLPVKLGPEQRAEKFIKESIVLFDQVLGKGE
jgi:hypothetical protein